ncbi:hypothetical protein KDA_35890 [Dictyobacter alpinus]|uniref:Uncharacterized protein n=1 Tax=Dictyobacter alpinus TaxID=2014873 RepID=A0A402B9S8_9CHLR|nr:hypothetical protein KDA_35890 [Dictyobacter alpinus]
MDVRFTATLQAFIRHAIRAEGDRTTPHLKLRPTLRFIDQEGLYGVARREAMKVLSFSPCKVQNGFSMWH